MTREELFQELHIVLDQLEMETDYAEIAHILSVFARWYDKLADEEAAARGV